METRSHPENRMCITYQPLEDQSVATGSMHRKFGEVVDVAFEICSHTDTERETDRRSDRQKSSSQHSGPLRGRSNELKETDRRWIWRRSSRSRTYMIANVVVSNVAIDPILRVYECCTCCKKFMHFVQTNGTATPQSALLPVSSVVSKGFFHTASGALRRRGSVRRHARYRTGSCIQRTKIRSDEMR